MGKDKVVIIVVATVVFSAILFGVLMAYRTYTLPMPVENIDKAIKMLKEKSDDENFRMHRLSMYNELSKSYKMRDKKTGEIRKFTQDEMDEIYNAIGGKEAVINYLKNIEDDEERRKELEFARYSLKIITDDEFAELLEISK